MVMNMGEEEIVLLSDDELAGSFVEDAYSMYMKEYYLILDLL